MPKKDVQTRIIPKGNKTPVQLENSEVPSRETHLEEEWSSQLYCATMPTNPVPEMGRILVTGASGYIGGRLVPELLARGYKVRIMVREESPELLERWPDAEVVIGNALLKETLEPVLAGVHTAYYLIHSLLLGPDDFEISDILAAKNFRQASEANKVSRIIYLGGLGDRMSNLSPHLRSRMQVAEELSAGPIPVSILRAAIIIGSGSGSYEIIKNLVKNLFILPIPKWAKTWCQPISIRDVIRYLVGTLETKATWGKSYDIGADEILTYEAMLKTLARILRLKRIFIASPISNIALFSYMGSLLTPVPHSIIRSLLEGSSNKVVCENDEIKKLIPFKTLTFQESIVHAMTREEQDRVSTRWSDAYPPAHELAVKLRELQTKIRFERTYSLHSTKSASALFKAICEIGGAKGWFNTNWMWRLRGMIDRLMMGVGTSRGRRNRERLQLHDVIDFWRVEEIIHDRLLLLRAEMILPGKAWLQFRIDPEDGANRVRVTAFYDSHTWFGDLYWYFFLPFHGIIFKDLLKQLDKAAE